MKVENQAYTLLNVGKFGMIRDSNTRMWGKSDNEKASMGEVGSGWVKMAQLPG